MSEENKKPSNDNSISQKPIPEISKLPDLSDGRDSVVNKSWDKVDGRINEIVDRGHTGIPPQKPIEKNDEKK